MDEFFSNEELSALLARQLACYFPMTNQYFVLDAIHYIFDDSFW